jgi:hypothetical protein
MSKPSHHHIVARARRLITKPDCWIQGELATTRRGTPVAPTHPRVQRFCAVGALTRATADRAP